MTEYVTRLTAVYRDQLDLYKQVLELAEREHEALAKCRPLVEVIESLEKKRDILRSIESLGLSVAAEKAHYQRNKTVLDARLTHQLNETIRSIKQVIRRIMEIERRNEETIMSAGAGAPVVPGQVVADGGGE